MKLETKLKHTPAPWQLSTITSREMHTIDGEDCLMVGGGDDGSMIVADIRTDDPHGVVAANARLIAAAPDLLDALMKATLVLHSAFENSTPLKTPHMKQFAVETAAEMTAALTKAIGENQE